MANANDATAGIDEPPYLEGPTQRGRQAEVVLVRVVDGPGSHRWLNRVEVLARGPAARYFRPARFVEPCPSNGEERFG
jgi:hypothetical protein